MYSLPTTKIFIMYRKHGLKNPKHNVSNVWQGCRGNKNVVALGLHGLKFQGETEEVPGTKSSRCDFHLIFCSFPRPHLGRGSAHILGEGPWDGNELTCHSSFAMIRDKAIYKITGHNRNCRISTQSDKTQKTLIKRKLCYTNPYPSPRVAAQERSPQWPDERHKLQAAHWGNQGRAGRDGPHLQRLNAWTLSNE